MAEDDIVQRIRIEGGDEGAAEFQKIASAGGSAFSAIRDAASRATNAVRGIGAGVSDAVRGINGINDTNAPQRLRDIERAAFRMGAGLSNAARGVAQFAQRLTLIGGGAAVAVAAIRTLSSAATGQARAERIASRERLADIRDEKGDVTALYNLRLQAADAQAKLNRDYAAGKLSLEDYTAALEENRQQTETNFRNFLLQDSQEEQARRRQFENMKRLREQESFDEVADKVGNQAAGAFMQLGRVIDQVMTRLKAILGPTIAEFVNSITTAIRDNQPQIIAFAEEIGAKFRSMFGQGFGETLKNAIPGVLDALRGVAAAIGIVVAAFKGLLKVLDAVAAIINKVFGTKISGAFLAGAIAVGLLVGAFSALVPIITAVVGVIGFLATTFGAIPIAITAVIAVIGVLLYRYFNSATWQQQATAIKNALSGAWEAIKQGVTEVIAAITDAFNGLIEFVTGIPQQLADLGTTLWQGIVDGANSAIEQVKQLWNDGISAVKQFFIDLGQAAIDLWNRIPQGLKDLFSGGGGGGDGASIGAFASGGHVRGPGTSTSDSILARLSNNEYVQRAAAVRKYGVGFMNSINSLRFPRHLADALTFASGGLVSAGATPPRYRAVADTRREGLGGDVLNLTLDGERFEGLRGPEDTMARLKKVAVRKAMSPRKPGWYKA